MPPRLPKSRRGARPVLRHGARPVLRHGVTLVELLVALGLLVAGLLALAGAAAQLARAESQALSDARAASALADRLERTAAAPCADTSSAKSLGRLTERWRTWTSDSVHWLADTARFPIVGDSSRVIGLTAPASCGR